MRKDYLTGLILILFIASKGNAQLTVEWNAWANIELAQGQETSHYYYNQIHKDYRGWRAGLSDLNIASNITIKPELKLNIRARLTRELGAKLTSFQLPLFNLQYLPKDKNWSILLGQFITPAGGFSDLQHPTDRIFIGEPLRHSYYTNISPLTGFAEFMGEQPFEVDNEVVWGSSILYYGAYISGLRFNWKIIPDKLSYTIALTNGSPNVSNRPFNLNNWGVINRIKYQPVYFWEQQFTVSYGSFQADNDETSESVSPFSQLLLGTDFELGYGFWAITGEVLHARYQVPQFFPDRELFSESQQNLSVTAYSLNAKYEFPFISGLYAALGVEALTFSEHENQQSYTTSQWDDNVWRITIGSGYKINEFLLFRLGYNIQQVDNHPVWEQNTFRAILTAHY